MAQTQEIEDDQVTRVLGSASEGDKQAAEDLIPLV